MGWMNSKNIDKLVAAALAIETQDARDAGALGFMARALTIATMPHKSRASMFSSVETAGSPSPCSPIQTSGSHMGLSRDC